MYPGRDYEHHCTTPGDVVEEELGQGYGGNEVDHGERQ